MRATTVPDIPGSARAGQAQESPGNPEMKTAIDPTHQGIHVDIFYTLERTRREDENGSLP
jgi:hypothetical protein